MTRDRSAIFISLADLLLCVVSVVIVAVAPTKAKTDGLKPKAEYLVQLDYPLSRDVDVDLWVIPPSRKPVFYGSRQEGCVDLDRDSLGFSTSSIILEDGTKVQSKSNVETTTLRCIEAGHYDIGANLFSFHVDSGEPVPVHVEITALNPSVRVVWAGDITLHKQGETVNAVSFDLDRDGRLTLVQPPLAPVTDPYRKGTP